MLTNSFKIFQHGQKLNNLVKAFFQREEPLVHILHNELSTLLRTIMNRICHSSVPQTGDAFDDTNNFILLNDINCGDGVSDELKKVKETDKMIFLTQAKKHYIAASKHIISKSGLNKPLLKYLHCLKPTNRIETSCKDIVKVAKELPFDISEGTVIDEWKLVCLEKCNPKLNGVVSIDVYWNQFLTITDDQGHTKYPTLAKVIKASLSLSNGSADVERGFSSSGRTLTSDRAKMSERTLDAHLHVKGYIQQNYDGKVHLVHVDKELRNLARTACASYALHCEKERKLKEQKIKEKEEEENRRSAQKELEKKLLNEKGSIDDKEKALKKLKSEEDEKQTTADRLFNDANDRLKQAIKKKDLVAVNVAQVMLESAAKLKEEADKMRRDVERTQKTIEKPRLQTSVESKEKWDLLSAVLLERKPIITPVLNELEKEFKEYLADVEFEKSVKNDIEIKLEKESKVLAMTKVVEDVDLVLKQTTQDFIEACNDEFNKFKAAERVTEADKKNDQTSLNRKLDKHLVLVKNQKVGNKKFYLLPQDKREEHETLRQCADRVIAENFEKDVKVLIYGNAPCGFYKYKYPKEVANRCEDAVGAKVFVYFARYVKGEIPKKDFKWLDREELNKILPSQYKDVISQVLIET